MYMKEEGKKGGMEGRRKGDGGKEEGRWREREKLFPSPEGS